MKGFNLYSGALAVKIDWRCKSEQQKQKLHSGKESQIKINGSSGQIGDSTSMITEPINMVFEDIARFHGGE
jgi:hypothetical protein